MTSSLFFGGSVIAAVIAGAIALFAPCCISVMLPAYFASSFQNRRVLIAMTFVFAAGIATIVLPIALGASLVRQLMTEQHTLIYTVGGLLMLALGVYVLLGGMLHLPMPTGRGHTSTGVLGVYTLGLFSGISSSCCAPVLAGVIALSSVASSFFLALVLGTAYVFGMVVPLFVIALLWELYDWRSSRLFRPRTFTWRVGPITRTLSSTNLASGILLLLIGGGMIWTGMTESAMPQLSEWQANLVVTLQHIGQVLTHILAWIPNWLGVVLLFLVLGWLVWYALKQTGVLTPHQDDDEELHEEPNLYAVSSVRQEEETIEQ
jgi:cytochrome c-type biogenesis protein